MRLFIAVDLPDEIKQYIASLQGSLPDEGISKTRGFHLTLKFLGECDENKKKAVEESLRRIKFTPFEAQLTEIGTFPPRKKDCAAGGGKIPRVVWAGVAVPKFVCGLAAEIERRMAGLGFKAEHRFTPHLTLARVRFIKNPADFNEILATLKLEPLKFRADEFSLFESVLSPAGARYKKLAVFR